MRRMLYTSIILLSVAGCMVGPDYHQPYIDIPHSFRYQPKFVSEASADTTWCSNLMTLYLMS